MNRLAALLLIFALYALNTTAAAQSTDERQPGDTRLDAHGIEQVWVPACFFMMGIIQEQIDQLQTQDLPAWVSRALPSESPAHEVCLTEGYWIDRTEVTNGAWQAFVDDGGYTTPDYWSEEGLVWLSKFPADFLPMICPQSSKLDHPRACITWYEAEAYARWRGGSLPTEAQWEYAARGPESLLYPWGNEWDAALANVIDSKAAVAVGSYPEGASWVGALDMAGNLMEWTLDWLDTDYYASSPQDDPAGPAEGQVKVERGGWWGSNEFVARSSYRHFEDPPTYQDAHIGVRIVSPAEAN
ncbi:MAG: SUMF1/EgtB/PvdO family nonheme iron enzyme [Chloroflexi bacterium]|nr:SUMF1/EgtB/PvdO family nonheme iron enzyme [Chloroflexota bacterium]